MPQVARITLYPMKSCDPIEVSEATLLPSSALCHDRQFALVDHENRFINAKRTPLIHQIRLMLDPRQRNFEIGRRLSAVELRGNLDEQGEALSDWLSRFFSLSVSIVENEEVGFPDDVVSPGPTIVSYATLKEVAGWFFGMSVDELRWRIRANIEIDGVEPFWEDRLFRADRQPKPFLIGGVVYGGINPCQRCVVPTRQPWTGEVTPTAFAQRFGELRKQNLPAWAPSEHFNHFYRLSTNTKLLEWGTGQIRVGDPVEIV